MSTTKEMVHDAMAKLKQQRDEIKLKIHLGEICHSENRAVQPELHDSVGS